MLTEEAFFEDIPVVLSASRLVQPLHEAPVAISVIDREMIEASGFTDVAEVLRFVPGFVAGHYRGHTPIVGYLFLNDSLSRRLQVMVDGRSIYAPTIGGPIWQTVPLNIEDIERIEVIRGPNAATYGSNSFLGVINIITRNPLLEQGFQISSKLGQDKLKEVSFRFNQSNNKLGYRASLWVQENDGFDQRHDAKRVKFFDTRGDYSVTENDTLRFHFGLSDAFNEWDEVPDPTTPEHEADLSAHYQLLKWEHRFRSGSDLFVKLYHNFDRHREEFNLEVPEIGQIPYDRNYRSDRYDLEFQVSQTPSPDLRFAWGGSSREDRVRAPRFLGEFDPVTIRTQRLFVNSAWHINNQYLLNWGLMAERTSITSDTISPLLALHYHINSQNSLRFTATQASRNPVAVEEYSDWRISVEGVGEQVIYTQMINMDAETIRGVDLGFMHRNPVHGSTYTVNVAQYMLKDMVTLESILEDSQNESDPHVHAFADDYDFTLRTAQFAMRRGLSEHVFLYASYGYTDVDKIKGDVADDTVDDATPMHQVASMISARFSQGYKASLNYFHRDKTRGLDGGAMRLSTDKLDLRVSKEFNLPELAGEFAVVGQNITDSYDGLYRYNDINPRWYFSFKLNL